MRYLVTAEEMRKYDGNTIQRIGIPGMVLMERAAYETFLVLWEKGLVVKGENALVLAGHGNNGGDGLALARMLIDAGMEVDLKLVGDEAKASEQWKEQRKILQAYPVKFDSGDTSKIYHLVIDALFGVGLSRKIEGEYAKAIEMVNAMKGFKVAMDVPSGIHSDDASELGISFKADLTVTYGFVKRGLCLYPGCSSAGEVRLAPIGIGEQSFFGETPTCFTMDESMEELLPKRKADGNKGTFGKALVIAGSKNMAGAAILCARACYRLGAGMVKVLSQEENRVILQESLPEALLGMLDDKEELWKSIAWSDVICIGPGLGRSVEAKGALETLLSMREFFEKPFVIDADGLNMIATEAGLVEKLKGQAKSGRTIVLTPHPMELRRLYDALYAKEKELPLEEFKKNLEKAAKRIAEELGVIVVAKDARTFVVAKGEASYLNLSGNSGMGTAGSGDVLAGIITSFFAQGKGNPFLETCKAVRVHGLLGDEAAAKLGEHGVMAGDLIL